VRSDASAIRGRLGARLVAFALAAAPASVALPDQPIGRLESLGRVLRQHAVWRADYHQEYVAAGMDMGEEVEGGVWVSWPDRALFREGSPLVRAMGLEGRTVRLVDLDVPSCDEHVLSDEEWARVPLAAVLDPGGAVERFSVLESGENGFALIPRQPGGVERVEVELDERGLPSRVVITDPQGAVNRLRFSSWEPAGAPRGGEWLPRPPDGVECVDDSGDVPG